MYKLLFIPFSILFLVGCGTEPSPRDDAMANMRARLEASQKQRFAPIEHKKVEHVIPAGSKEKAKGDPTAYEYNDKVLSIEDEKAWQDIGVDNQEYPQWAELNMSAKEVKDWKDLGISYAAIVVFKEQDFTPITAKKFLKKEFASRPSFYKQFGTPVYEFDEICKGVIKRQQPAFAYLEDRCLPYMKESNQNEVLGHLLDRAGLTKGALAVEYMAELRRLTEKNSEIQSGMEVSIEEFVEDDDSPNFIYLFPLLQSEPSEKEMNYIDKNKIDLQKSERYLSYKDSSYWDKKAAAKKAMADAAARQEEAMRIKKESDKAKTMQMQRVALEQNIQKELNQKEENRRAKALELCGNYINKDHISNQKVLLEGIVVFTVDTPGDKMFGYGVQAREDQKIYFVRDPENSAKVKTNTTISWTLKTMGRTEALSPVSPDTFVYDKKSKEKFTMALYLAECIVK